MNYTTITSREKYADATVTYLERNPALPCFSKEAKVALIVTNYNSAAIHLEDGENNEIASFYFDLDVLISILTGEDKVIPIDWLKARYAPAIMSDSLSYIRMADAVDAIIDEWRKRNETA